jgi:hypothetical protein
MQNLRFLSKYVHGIPGPCEVGDELEELENECDESVE